MEWLFTNRGKVCNFGEGFGLDGFDEDPIGVRFVGSLSRTSICYNETHVGPRRLNQSYSWWEERRF